MKSERGSLAEIVDAAQAAGRYVITRDEAQAALGLSDEALKKAVARLVAKSRLAVPRRGFYVIVPLEYRDAGVPPATWFIDDLMKFHAQPYYVGLLSAASLHGAAHQQPQELQVLTTKQLREATAGRARIRFFKKARAKRTPVTAIKTETGTMNVSTPEGTALDLVRYPDAAGQLGTIVTVVAELAERLDPTRLVEAAKKEDDLMSAQRLGHMLELVGAQAVAEPLAAWVSRQHPRYIALRPGRSTRRARKDTRWHVVVNEKLEAEA